MSLLLTIIKGSVSTTGPFMSPGCSLSRSRFDLKNVNSECSGDRYEKRDLCNSLRGLPKEAVNCYISMSRPQPLRLRRRVALT